MSQNAAVRRGLAVLASGLTFSAWLVLVYTVGLGLHVLSGYATVQVLGVMLAVALTFLVGLGVGLRQRGVSLTFLVGLGVGLRQRGVSFARGEAVEVTTRRHANGAASIAVSGANGKIGVTISQADAEALVETLGGLGQAGAFAAALNRAGAESKPLRDHLADLRDDYRLLSVYVDGLVDARANQDAAGVASYGRAVEERAVLCGRALLSAYQAGAFASASSTDTVKGNA